MPIPRNTRTHLPSSSRTVALRTPFLAPADTAGHAPTIPRSLPTPRTSEMPQRRRARREVLPSMQVVGKPLPEDPTVERPAEVNGITVLREQRLANYKGAFFKISKLFLADGEVVWGCWDCLYVSDSRGAIMAHRNDRHGARYGQKGPRKPEVAPPVAQLQLEPQAQGLEQSHALEPIATEPVATERVAAEEEALVTGDSVPATIAEMTVGGIRSLADIIERLQAENGALRSELDKAGIDRVTQHKIDVYETNRLEIVELRAVKAAHDKCDDLRAEVKELRAFRRKATRVMGQMGQLFNMEEN